MIVIVIVISNSDGKMTTQPGACREGVILHFFQGFPILL